MRLIDVDSGAVVVLGAPDVSIARARRLAELGLRAGERVEVLQRTAGGGRLIGVGHARIALDRTTAQAIPVEGDRAALIDDSARPVGPARAGGDR